MHWIAATTVPGSQKPQREYVTEQTARLKDGRPRGKGYRIVPSLNPNYSAVELALSKAGFEYYMPAEKRLIRDRRHTDLWKVRRFALMVGWIFVRMPCSCEKGCLKHTPSMLLEVPGVAGYATKDGINPMPISIAEILSVRAAEADAEVEFDKQTRTARKNLRKNAKTDPRLQMLVDRLDIAGNISVPLDSEALAA